jgi:hypothetical protein
MNKPRLQHNLNKEQLVNLTSMLNEKSQYITNQIAKNIGKHPLLYRRARTITEKIGELLVIIEEA